jgi:hypothetical protein
MEQPFSVKKDFTETVPSVFASRSGASGGAPVLKLDDSERTELIVNAQPNDKSIERPGGGRHNAASLAAMIFLVARNIVRYVLCTR